MPVSEKVARATGSLTLLLGTVPVPCKVYAATDGGRRASTHHDPEYSDCGGRLRQEHVCPVHGTIGRGEQCRGYEVARGEYVLLSAAESAALTQPSTESVALEQFVAPSEIDPIYYDGSSYLGPQPGAERAYRLLDCALVQAGVCAIARYASRGSMRTVAILPTPMSTPQRYRGPRVLMMHRLRYAAHVRAPETVPLGHALDVNAADLNLAVQIVGARRARWVPSDYVDPGVAPLEYAIAAKVAAGEVITAAAAPAVDLSAALKESLPATPVPSKAVPAKRRRKAAK